MKRFIIICCVFLSACGNNKPLLSKEPDRVTPEQELILSLRSIRNNINNQLSAAIEVSQSRPLTESEQLALTKQVQVQSAKWQTVLPASLFTKSASVLEQNKIESAAFNTKEMVFLESVDLWLISRVVLSGQGENQTVVSYEWPLETNIGPVIYSQEQSALGSEESQGLEINMSLTPNTEKPGLALQYPEKVSNAPEDYYLQAKPSAQQKNINTVLESISNVVFRSAVQNNNQEDLNYKFAMRFNFKTNIQPKFKMTIDNLKKVIENTVKKISNNNGNNYIGLKQIQREVQSDFYELEKSLASMD